MSGDADVGAPERLVNPFFAGWRRHEDAEHDWRLFKETAEWAIPTSWH